MAQPSRAASLREALEHVQGAFAEAERARDNWDGPTAKLPTAAIAYAEALHIVQRREDDKRRRESRHEAKSKKKGAQEQAHLPGSRPGFDPEVSAFWMVMEVRTAARAAGAHQIYSGYALCSYRGWLSVWAMDGRFDSSLKCIALHAGEVKGGCHTAPPAAQPRADVLQPSLCDTCRRLGTGLPNFDHTCRPRPYSPASTLQTPRSAPI